MDQQEAKLTSRQSASSSTAGRGALDQQRDLEGFFLSESTPAFTYYGIAETFEHESQQVFANNFHAYPTTIASHDLQDAGSHPVDASTMHHEPLVEYMEDALACLYHGHVLQGHSINAQPGHGLSPMERYIAEGSSERYAVLPRSISGKGPTHNGCRCLQLIQSHDATNDRAQK